MMKEIGIGIIGVGVVGSSVVKILQKNQEIISARTGAKLVVKQGVVSDINKKRDVDIPLSNRIEDVIYNPDIDIVIELIGGVDRAYQIACEVLKSGKNLVTANKAMLAYHRYDLESIAGNCTIGFEASVCGGIPVIKALRDGLGANHILSLRGILNGTSNYILSKMTRENEDFASALKDAQERGYAEKDPTLDINGVDAGQKLIILASLAYGINAYPEDIVIEGIDRIETSDIAFAKEFGYVIKLLGIANKHGDEVELRVHPALVKNDEMVAKVDGVMNAVSVVGDCVGEMLYYGAGAGGDATASAVISDLIEIARRKHSRMLGFDGMSISHTLRDKNKITSRYYIRLKAYDKAGVLAQVSSIFSKNDISIQVLFQPESKDNIAQLLFITHLSAEMKVLSALREIDTQSFIAKESFFIRIHD